MRSLGWTSSRADWLYTHGHTVSACICEKHFVRPTCPVHGWPMPKRGLWHRFLIWIGKRNG